MPFHLNVARSGSHRRAADGQTVAGGASGASRGAFLRGVVLGFASAFVVFDWLFTGSAMVQGAARHLQQLLGLRG
jgi:hypothetical protein